MNKNKKIAVCALLSALALVLSFFESMLPNLPMMPPGAKPGLSNIVNMFAAGVMGFPYALFIAVIKGGFALFTRGAVAGLMSISGGIISTILAWILLKNTKFSYVFIGVACALSHNLMQALVAFALTSAGVLYYIPMLLIFGVASGILTGFILKMVYIRLPKILLEVKNDVSNS